MDRLNIGVIGTGYVGLVTAACFANLGFNTICYDINYEKVDLINKGITPIYENNLDILLQNVVNKYNTLEATTKRNVMLDASDIIFVCLPTPSLKNGSIDLKYILEELTIVGQYLSSIKSFKTIVIKSTVVPGTTSNLIQDILESTSNKKMGIDFGLIVNPEFLKEGSAIEDFNNPDRIIIGYHDNKSENQISKLYGSFNVPYVKVTFDEAEMIKYVANCFLATKISFINEIANLSENFNINMDNIVKGISHDQRISPKFLNSGLGFGGSCFPKDLNALYALSKDLNVELQILKSTLKVNVAQPFRVIKILSDLMDLKNLKITLLGLSFKPNTDDLREAPSLKISEELKNQGSKIFAYDPVFINKSIRKHDYIQICDNIDDALLNSDAAIVITEWDEFKSLKPINFKNMKNKLVIDGRRILDANIFRESGIKLITIGNSQF